MDMAATEYNEDREFGKYVAEHYSRYHTPLEERVAIAILAASKEAIGNPDFAKILRKKHKLDSDPEVVRELADGADAFRLRVAERIVREHGIVVNRCPRCKRVVRTPKAAQCFWCGFDWHAAQT
jgi:hypothetical protein